MKTLSILIVACFVAFPIAAQQTLLVPSQYATIQAAINAAANGDTILVSPGVYVEQINFIGKSVVLESTQGASTTTIDGAGVGTVVTFESGEVGAVLRGITITNGLGTSFGIHGGGIVARAGSSPLIEECVVVGNQSPHTGGGIYIHYASPTIRNCVVDSNAAAGFGGGIAADTSSPTITGCIVSRNTVSGTARNGGYGGGIWIDQMSATITNCTIANNTSAQDGGGLACFGSAVLATNCIIWGNSPNQAIEVGNIGTLINSSSLQTAWLGPGSGNSVREPHFVDSLNGDFHLSPWTLCSDIGSSSAPGLTATDIDGEPRIQFGGVDLGADELSTEALAALGLAGSSNVGLGLGGPFDLLTINGSDGLPARRVDVGIGSPITIAVAQPPTNPLPSSFALIGFIGVPTSADAYTLPFGIGTLCFPAPQLIPSYPGLFTLTNNFGPEPGQLVGSNPAPWSFTAAGLPFAFQFTLQGVIQQDPGTVRVMNGVIVNVQ